jgi:hypothetical protein
VLKSLLKPTKEELAEAKAKRLFESRSTQELWWINALQLDTMLLPDTCDGGGGAGSSSSTSAVAWEGHPGWTMITKMLGKQRPRKNTAYYSPGGTRYKSKITADRAFEDGGGGGSGGARTDDDSSDINLSDSSEEKEDTADEDGPPAKKRPRAGFADKANNQTALWTPAENMQLLEHMAKHGETFGSIASVLERDTDQVRQQWDNRVSPAIDFGEWTQPEDEFIGMQGAGGTRQPMDADCELFARQAK